MSEHDPDQYGHPTGQVRPETLENNLADWIDTQVIAKAIIEEMHNEGVDETLENAQKIWLASLEDLWVTVHSTIQALF